MEKILNLHYVNLTIQYWAYAALRIVFPWSWFSRNDRRGRFYAWAVSGEYGCGQQFV